MTIQQYPTEELQAELDRRNGPRPDPPMPICTPDLRPLRDLCQAYIDALTKDVFVDDDLRHYIYEAALEAFFGKDVWTWINSRK